MFANRPMTGVAVLLLVVFSAGHDLSAQGKGKGKGPPPDLDREILKQLKEAYKAPLEVYQDVRDDLRSSYKPGAKSREASIIKDLHRIYEISASQEAALLKELRKLIEKPSTENEQYFFEQVSTLRKLPEGTVPAATQLNQVAKLFERLDEDRNGKLDSYEMSEDLKGKRGKWDANRDGLIAPEEYWAYYQDRLRSLSQDVATGKIDLGLKRGGPVIPAAEERRPIMFRAGKLPKNLPPWFVKLDADNDGQISLFEWRRSGKSIKEFTDADRNGDGLVTAEETLRYVAMLETAPVVSSNEAGTLNSQKKNKKKK